MLFKKFFFATLAGTIAAGVIGILFAYCELGAWALIMQMLVNVFVDTLMLWINIDWRPKWIFSLDRLKLLFNFGWKILASQIVITLFTQIRQVLIGKVYSREDLAYYNYGDKIPNLIAANVNSSIDSVLFPALSAEQDNVHRVKNMTKRAITVSSYVMMPLLIGLAVCAEPLVRVVLTDKWLPCVLYLRIFCIVYVFFPIHTANLNAIKSMGFSNETLKIELIKAVINVIVLLISLPFGTFAITIGFLFSSLASLLVNAWPNRKIINYGIREQFTDIMPIFILSLAMGLIMYLIGLAPLPEIVLLVIQVVSGGIIYILSSRALRLTSFAYLEEIIKSYFTENSSSKSIKETVHD